MATSQSQYRRAGRGGLVSTADIDLPSRPVTDGAACTLSTLRDAAPVRRNDRKRRVGRVFEAHRFLESAYTATWASKTRPTLHPTASNQDLPHDVAVDVCQPPVD